MASLPDISPRPSSVAEYHRMVDAGILTEDDRVETSTKASPGDELRSSAAEGVAVVVGDLFA